MTSVVVSHIVFWPVHHFEHRQTTRTEKPHQQHECNYQKDEIEYSGIVPLDARGQGNNVFILSTSYLSSTTCNYVTMSFFTGWPIFL
jgi:hypothetical protein